MAGERLPEILAVTIERKEGLRCGSCGGRHVETVQELRGVEHACACRCCHGAFVESLEADFPDLITTRGGVRVVTQAALDEAIRRMEADIASLERDDQAPTTPNHTARAGTARGPRPPNPG